MYTTFRTKAYIFLNLKQPYYNGNILGKCSWSSALHPTIQLGAVGFCEGRKRFEVHVSLKDTSTSQEDEPISQLIKGRPALIPVPNPPLHTNRTAEAQITTQITSR